MMRRDVFQAIADPTRREIIHLLAHGPLNLNAVAANFSITRPAISRHIKILTQCGLVIIHQEGRERFCEANLRPLASVAQWVERYRVFWTTRFDALENFLNASADIPVEETTPVRVRSEKKRKRKL